MAMDYLDYGFYQENGQPMKNITAFAFMHYNQQEKNGVFIIKGRQEHQISENYLPPRVEVY
ncbi:hypothetical protein L7G72_20755 [Xenorhabdus bovienii]|uniref:hypothetical protein n=1 Tax=Xenorhabdus bovienii TaxID=40576 RepID=UPI001EE120B0|nr:hypothetical protein [Xenorhabdus bovienii]MCG3464181.1 hypothetical protein [Xenorhabdus bovienii]